MLSALSCGLPPLDCSLVMSALIRSEHNYEISVSRRTWSTCSISDSCPAFLLVCLCCLFARVLVLELAV